MSQFNFFSLSFSRYIKISSTHRAQKKIILMEKKILKVWSYLIHFIYSFIIFFKKYMETSQMRGGCKWIVKYKKSQNSSSRGEENLYVQSTKWLRRNHEWVNLGRRRRNNEQRVSMIQNNNDLCGFKYLKLNANLYMNEFVCVWVYVCVEE